MLISNNKIILTNNFNHKWPKRIVFYYFIKEKALLKFMYLSVLIIKGGSKFLLYIVSENLYYYLKLPAKILKDQCLYHRILMDLNWYV